MADSSTSSGALPIWVWPVAALVGAFLINAVPHGVMGITGQAFPTLFSGGPPNLSPAWLNVVWSLINLAVGFGLLRLINRWSALPSVRWTMIVAAAVFALLLAWGFETMM